MKLPASLIFSIVIICASCHAGKFDVLEKVAQETEYWEKTNKNNKKKFDSEFSRKSQIELCAMDDSHKRWDVPALYAIKTAHECLSETEKYIIDSAIKEALLHFIKTPVVRAKQPEKYEEHRTLQDILSNYELLMLIANNKFCYRSKAGINFEKKEGLFIIDALDNNNVNQISAAYSLDRLNPSGAIKHLDV